MLATAILMKELEQMPEESVAEVLDFALFLKSKTKNNVHILSDYISENKERFPNMNAPVHLGFDLKNISREEINER
jgi:hypothetical protein